MRLAKRSLNDIFRRAFSSGVVAVVFLANAFLVVFAVLPAAPAFAAGVPPECQQSAANAAPPAAPAGTQQGPVQSSTSGSTQIRQFTNTYPNGNQCTWKTSTYSSGPMVTDVRTDWLLVSYQLAGQTAVTPPDPNKPPADAPPPPNLPKYDSIDNTDQLFPGETNNCRLVDATDPLDPDAVNGKKPNTQGALWVKHGDLTGANGGSSVVKTNAIIVYFPGERCDWAHSDQQAFGAWTLWSIGTHNSCIVSNNYDICPIIQMGNGLIFFTLILSVLGIFISVGLWAVGSRGQNPGQELTGKRGLVICLAVAFVAGALPSIILYAQGQTRNADTVGITTVTLPGG